jgi:hypothetical protein
MSTLKNHERKTTTEKVDELLGNKFCRSCRAHRAMFGGTFGQDRVGRKTWMCCACSTRLKNRKTSRPPEGEAIEVRTVTEVTPAPASDLMATESGVSHSQDTNGHDNNTHVCGGQTDD